MFGFNKKKYKVGIALGGGGARGFAHLGVIKALKEKGIAPDIISGVSAGAIAGAFISSGHSPDEAFEVLKKFNFTGISEFKLPKTGFLSLNKLTSLLKQHITTTNIESLQTPFIIGVTNMLDGKPEYIKVGPLHDFVQASASIPVLYSPVRIQNKLYADGGICDNVPITPLKDTCRKVIGVSISPIHQMNELSNLIHVTTRMFQLAVNRSSEELSKSCDLLIELHELRKYDLMDTKHAKEIFDIGYEYTRSLDFKL